MTRPGLRVCGWSIVFAVLVLLTLLPFLMALEEDFGGYSAFMSPVCNAALAPEASKFSDRDQDAHRLVLRVICAFRSDAAEAERMSVTAAAVKTDTPESFCNAIGDMKQHTSNLRSKAIVKTAAKLIIAACCDCSFAPVNSTCSKGYSGKTTTGPTPLATLIIAISMLAAAGLLWKIAFGQKKKKNLPPVSTKNLITRRSGTNRSRQPHPQWALPCFLALWIVPCKGSHVTCASGQVRNVEDTGCMIPGLQWVLGSNGQDCNTVCSNAGAGRTCAEGAFSGITWSEALLRDSVKGGATCSGYYSTSYTRVPCQDSSGPCIHGSGGTCAASDSNYARFCPCTCAAGTSSSLGTTAACEK